MLQPANTPHDQLAQLRGDQDQGCQADALQPGLGLKGHGTEGLAQEGQVDHCHLQEDGDADGTPQPGIAEEADEGGLPGRARSQGVEKLGEDQDGEAHGPGLPHLGLMADGLEGAVGEEPPAQVHVHADQGDQGHDQADVDDVDPHVPIDHPIAHPAGRAVHQVVGLGVHAHGQGRGRIGQEVDPEELGGQEGDGDAQAAGLGDAQKSGEDHASEDREDLTHVGAEQVAQELADVVEDAAALAHGLDDGGEVVIRQNHLGRFLGHLGSGDPHGHAYVGGLTAGASLTPSPVMATTRPWD